MERLVRDFSKEHSPNERGELAAQIKNQRKEARGAKNEFESLKEQLDAASDNTFRRIINFVKISKLRNKIGIAKENSDQANADYAESASLITDFYEKQNEEWRNLPFESSDIEKYFNPEYLKSLSLEDYQRVLQRFGGGMVTHVTRQGIRDHSDMGIMGHHGGEGEMHNGFKEIMKDHKLSYNLAQMVAEANRKANIAEYLRLDECETKEKAVARLNSFTAQTRQHAAGSFVDMHGPHFAVERVSDEYYGGETGNEVFFAFPSYMIAANFFHKKDPHVPNEATNYNDLWLYLKPDDEIDINSGIVFIPEDAQVNPETGSIYETDSRGKAKNDVELLNSLVALVSTNEFRKFSKKASERIGTLDYNYKDYLEKGSRPHKAATTVYQEIEQELRQIKPDIKEKEMLIIVEYWFLNNIPLDTKDIAEKISGRMAATRQTYVKAQHTISSKEYWDTYFSGHPGSKPNKIVYYQFGNPNAAFDHWKNHSAQIGKSAVVNMEQNRILKTTLGETPDLPEEILTDISTFRNEALQVIDKHFAKRQTGSETSSN